MPDFLPDRECDLHIRETPLFSTRMRKGIYNFLPDYEYHSLFEIDTEIFNGKELIIFDVDNTLFFSETQDTTQEVINWFNKIKKKYTCVCVSNSSTIARRAPFIEQLIGCKIFLNPRQKPSTRLFREICQRYATDADKVIIVGDRIFTDILFGNLSNAMTVLVEPLDSKEYFFIKVFRLIERCVVSLSKKMRKFSRPPLLLKTHRYTCVDMHLHTEYSKDSFGNVKKYLQIAKEKGFGLAITDHNEIDGAIYAVQHSDGVLVIPGMELKSYNGVDLNIYFYELKDLIEFYKTHVAPAKQKDDFVPAITVEEVLNAASQFKCVVATPHPFSLRSIGFGDVLNRNVIKPDLLEKIDCVEIINGTNSKVKNLKARRWAKHHNKRPIGGSDAHAYFDVGKVLTCIKVNEGEHFLDAIQRRDATVIEMYHTSVTPIVMFVLGQLRLLTFSNGVRRFCKHIYTCVSLRDRTIT